MKIVCIAWRTTVHCTTTKVKIQNIEIQHENYEKCILYIVWHATIYYTKTKINIQLNIKIQHKTHRLQFPVQWRRWKYSRTSKYNIKYTDSFTHTREYDKYGPRRRDIPPGFRLLLLMVKDWESNRCLWNYPWNIT